MVFLNVLIAWIVASLVMLIPTFVTSLFIELHGSGWGIVSSAGFLAAIWVAFYLFMSHTSGD